MSGLGMLIAVVGFVLSVLYWLWFTRSINYINAQLGAVRESLDIVTYRMTSMDNTTTSMDKTLLRISDLAAKQAKREERQLRRQADERISRRNGE